MRRRTKLGTATLLAVLVPAAMAFAAQYSVEEDDASVASGSSGSATATCPKGSALSGGGYFVDAFFTPHTERGFFPTGKRAFRTSIVNTNIDLGDPPIELTSYGVCDKTGRYSIASRTASFSAAGTKSATAKCPRGSRVSGGGVKLIDDEVELIASRPAGPRGWRATASYAGGGVAAIEAKAFCDRQGGDYAVRKVTRQASPAGPPGPRRRGLISVQIIRAKAQCPSGHRATGGGWALADGARRVYGSVPVGQRSWEATMNSVPGDPTKLTSYAVCKAN